jgi:RNA polymerase sigma-70 factor (ECF subfamily)
VADDLFQESYLRLLRAKLPLHMDDQHRKNYLFRIATNLLREHQGRPRAAAGAEKAGHGGAAEALDRRHDLRRALHRLKPRERELLWLAYVEGLSHHEIALVVGAKEQSIRPMLARARGSLARLLRRWGWVAPGASGEKP